MTNYTRVTKKIMYDSSPIAYWVEGDSAHIPLVLLSGFTGTHADLLELARHLKDDFFLIIPEFPGWGKSPQGNSRFTIHDYSKVVEHILDDLKIQKAVLVGHCMGAVVAIECGFLFPNKITQLLLVSPPYQNNTWGQIFFKTMLHISKKVPVSLRPIFFFWRSRFITIPISFVAIQTRKFSKKLHLIEKTMIQQPYQNEHVLETNWNSLIDYDYQKARAIHLPVHIIHGEKDILIPPLQAVRLSKLFQNVTIDILAHAGHLPPTETPVSLARVFKKYLR